jgi:hypothetical protein
LAKKIVMTRHLSNSHFKIVFRWQKCCSEPDAAFLLSKAGCRYYADSCLFQERECIQSIGGLITCFRCVNSALRLALDLIQKKTGRSPLSPCGSLRRHCRRREAGNNSSFLRTKSITFPAPICRSEHAAGPCRTAAWLVYLTWIVSCLRAAWCPDAFRLYQDSPRDARRTAGISMKLMCISLNDVIRGFNSTNILLCGEIAC